MIKAKLSTLDALVPVFLIEMEFYAIPRINETVKTKDHSYKVVDVIHSENDLNITLEPIIH